MECILRARGMSECTQEAADEPRGVREHKRVKARKRNEQQSGVEARDKSVSRGARARAQLATICTRATRCRRVRNLCKGDLMGFYQ